MTQRDPDLPRVLPPATVDDSSGPTPAAEGLSPRGVNLEDEDLTQWATFGNGDAQEPVPQRLARARESGLGEILDEATTDQLREIIAAAQMRLSDSDDAGEA